MEKIETATFAGGCFWCTEAVFQRIKGVSSVVPGYSGGNVENPTYEEVSRGQTGHFEAIQIKFNSNEVSFEKLLEVFFKTHNPTQIGGQGHDIGPQYESAVFYHNKNQKIIVQEIIKKIEEAKIYESKIVTKVLLYKNFYVAENYHLNYYLKNKNAAYCQLVINPKIKKLEELFGLLIKQ